MAAARLAMPSPLPSTTVRLRQGRIQSSPGKPRLACGGGEPARASASAQRSREGATRSSTCSSLDQFTFIGTSQTRWFAHGSRGAVAAAQPFACAVQLNADGDSARSGRAGDLRDREVGGVEEKDNGALLRG